MAQNKTVKKHFSDECVVLINLIEDCFCFVAFAKIATDGYAPKD
jgi:hypothetical protein